MKLPQLIFICLSGLLLGKCVYPAEDYKQPDFKQYLVVDANISDSLSEVKLNLSSPNPKVLTSPAVPLAKVYLTDSRSVSYNLPEVFPGIYRAVQRLQVGESYQLHIERQGGQKYESVPEVMPTCPAIDKLFYRFDQKDNFPEGNENRNGFNVYVNFKDSPQPEEFYQWNWIHYERASYCKINRDNKGELHYIYYVLGTVEAL